MSEVRARIAAGIRAWAIGYYGMTEYLRIEANRSVAQEGK